MKNIKIIAAFILFLFIVQTASSQTKKQLFDAYAATGDSCLLAKNYYGAHQAYEKALSFKEDITISYKCAEVCRQYQNYADAERYYRIALAEDSVTFPYAKFFFAEMLKYQQKYQEASEQYYEFYKLNRRSNNYYTNRAVKEYKICEKILEKTPVIENLNIRRLDNDSINTMYSEYAPLQYNDTLFFFGGIRAKDKKLADSLFLFNNYWNILSQAEYNAEDSSYFNIRYVEDLNEDNFHVGNISFNKEGNVAYYSKCKDYDCKIYRAKFDHKTGRFTQKEELPASINMPKTTSTTPHLAVTATGEILFFASDRKKGGAGRLDIWYSVIDKDGKFLEPESVSKRVNTKANDVTPFYDARDSLLYFSTEWHPGLGGYDIFSTKVNWAEKTWSKPQNVGKPINSSYNDLYYSYSRDSLRAYWVSNRKESKQLIEKAHSNDIYTHPLIGKTIARIEDLVPISLYFDNDYPDPRSKDTVTDKAYEQLFEDFFDRQQEYVDIFTRNSSFETYKFDKKNMETFFTEMEREYKKLSLFAELLEVILEDGQDIIIVFKGYASPVGNTAYNEIVAKRRISCIQNFFDNFNGGVLNKYMENEPGTKTGSLKYGHQPIGETVLDNTFVTSSGEQVSAISDRKQKWMSVYSPAAAFQRKIEIVAVDIEYEDQLYETINREVSSSKKMFEDDGTPINPETESDDEFYADDSKNEEYEDDSDVIFVKQVNGEESTSSAINRVSTKPRTVLTITQADDKEDEKVKAKEEVTKASSQDAATDDKKGKKKKKRKNKSSKKDKKEDDSKDDLESSEEAESEVHVIKSTPTEKKTNGLPSVQLKTEEEDKSGLSRPETEGDIILDEDDE